MNDGSFAQVVGSAESSVVPGPCVEVGHWERHGRSERKFSMESRHPLASPGNDQNRSTDESPGEVLSGIIIKTVITVVVAGVAFYLMF